MIGNSDATHFLVRSGGFLQVSALDSTRSRHASHTLTSRSACADSNPPGQRMGHLLESRLLQGCGKLCNVGIR
jgi:hypothetical protein